jgi:hypothetical protein
VSGYILDYFLTKILTPSLVKSSADACIALDDGMTENNKLESIWKEAARDCEKL